jgi:hypothetical protein
MGHLGYTAFMEAESEKGTWEIVDDGEGAPAMTIECGETVNCTLDSEEVVLDIEGGAPAIVTAKEEIFEEEGGSACPAEAAWTAKYSVEVPQPARFSRRIGRLCKAAPTEAGTCPAGQAFNGSIEASLLTGVEAKFESTVNPFETVLCEEAPMQGEFMENGKGKLTVMKFNTLLGDCNSVNVKGEPTVKVQQQGLPLERSSFARTPTRQILIGGARSSFLGLTFESVPVVECFYRPSRATWVIYANEPMRIESVWRGVRLTLVSDVGCPELLKLSGKWKVTKLGGGNLWVTG